MVAAARPDETSPAGRGELGVEAVLEDRGRAGEARGLRAGVEPRGQVDEEDDRER